jgi:Mg2+ and Co2+ transporter CorA
MDEPPNELSFDAHAGGEELEPKELFRVFPDVDSFAEAIKSSLGFNFDFSSLLELNTDFIQSTDKYLLLNIKEFNGETPDNILLLTEDEAYICSYNAPSTNMVKVFEDVLQKPFGKSTVISFLVINQILSNHKEHLESLLEEIKKLENSFNHDRYRALSLEFDRFSDRLEEFHDLIIGLQERRYKQVETQYISFDYRVLIAESLSLQARCRRRMSTLKDLRQDHEMKATEELNNKIVNLNNVLKKLTSITVILMLPTLIASHFGMNFLHMPELSIWWAYPAVIGAQIVIMVVFFFVFRKIGWL